MEEHGIFGNPLFVDEENVDYRPSENSPAIDAGQNLGAPYNIDITGVKRPQGAAYDIGAFEIMVQTK